MAPFSICSKCKIRTRKVIRDPITLKDIYMCPKCCKAKNEAQMIENERDKKKSNQQQELPAREEDKPVVKPVPLPVAQAVVQPLPQLVPQPEVQPVPQRVVQLVPQLVPLAQPQPQPEVQPDPQTVPQKFVHLQEVSLAQLISQTVPQPQPQPQPQLQPVKLPLIAAKPATTVNSNAAQKYTPPLMQTVVINGRKYIAISATASDN